MIRKVIHFSVMYRGGVGFRYTTRSLADGFAVTGYVRNLLNGSYQIRIAFTQRRLRQRAVCVSHAR